MVLSLPPLLYPQLVSSSWLDSGGLVPFLIVRFKLSTAANNNCEGRVRLLTSYYHREVQIMVLQKGKHVYVIFQIL